MNNANGTACTCTEKFECRSSFDERFLIMPGVLNAGMCRSVRAPADLRGQYGRGRIQQSLDEQVQGVELMQNLEYLYTEGGQIIPGLFSAVSYPTFAIASSCILIGKRNA